MPDSFTDRRMIPGRLGAFALWLALALAGCASEHGGAVPGGEGASSVSTGVAAREPAQMPAAVQPVLPAPRPDATPRATYFEGTGKFLRGGPPTLPAVVRTGRGVALQFRDSDIRTVIDAVLGDVLKLPYMIDPAVQGSLSLETSDELADGDLLFVLEEALRLQNVALLKSDGRFHIVPMADAPRRVSSLGSAPPESVGRPGFAVQVVTLKYVDAIEMARILEPFAPRGGVLQVDESRNLLILAGTGREIASMLRTVATFDVDWMRGMSFALYRMNYVEAETLAKELSQIFNDAGSPVAGLVRLIPIARMNAILAVSPQIEHLQHVEQWIDRLDLGGGGTAAGRRIYIYHVQNGRSGDLAASLNSILAADRFHTQEGVSVAGVGAPVPDAPDQRSRGYSAPNSGDAGAGETNVFASSGLKIVPNEENNSLLILATPDEFSVLDSALRQLDIPPRQVLIEASLAEVELTDELRYGVQWFFEPGDNTIVLSEADTGAVVSAFPGFSYVFNGAADARIVLNALDSVTDVNLISSPKLLVLNNQPATLQIGDQVPVAVQSAVGVADPDAPIVNSVELRDTGVILTVVPRVNEGGLVLLDIDQEVSNVIETTTSGIDSPTIQQRKITSTVAVRNGETIALGGLIRESYNDTRTGVPILKDIPLLGAAFRSTNIRKRRTELIVLITPRVLDDPRDTQDVMTYLQGEFRSFSNLMAGDAGAQ